MHRVQFFFHNVSPFLRERRRLKHFIQDLFLKENKRLGAISYIFCSDEDLLAINKKFLQHDYYTDIITFDLSSSKIEIGGEVYISLDRVKDNSRLEGVSFKEELHRVIFHGALHLCGYKDKTKKETKEMRRKETKYLRAYL